MRWVMRSSLPGRWQVPVQRCCCVWQARTGSFFFFFSFLHKNRNNPAQIVAKYYKNHEWLTFFGINNPRNPPLIRFTTDFGVTFGVFICFDIMFPTPAVQLAGQGVEHFVYPVAMDNSIGKKLHALWSYMPSTVLLAANLGESYSGIFESGSELVSELVRIDGHPTDSLRIAHVERA